MKSNKCRSIDYSEITELPQQKASQEQLSRLYQRYHFAKQLAKDKHVLEVACGCGMGIGYLAQDAKRVVGGDIEERNLSFAKTYYRKRSNIDLSYLDANDLPFTNESFDLVFLFEAIYYLQYPTKFISESARVLKESGIVIISTVNKDWKDFHQSLYAHNYFSVPELHELLNEEFVEIDLFGGFEVENGGIKNWMTSSIKRLAVDLNLLPGSLQARTYLKRIFMGKLVPLPNEVYADIATYDPPVHISKNEVNSDFKIIYAVAQR